MNKSHVPDVLLGLRGILGYARFVQSYGVLIVNDFMAIILCAQKFDDLKYVYHSVMLSNNAASSTGFADYYLLNPLIYIYNLFNIFGKKEKTATYGNRWWRRDSRTRGKSLGSSHFIVS